MASILSGVMVYVIVAHGERMIVRKRCPRNASGYACAKGPVRPADPMVSTDGPYSDALLVGEWLAPPIWRFQVYDLSVPNSGLAPMKALGSTVASCKMSRMAPVSPAALSNLPADSLQPLQDVEIMRRPDGL
jgi:hypothetical protein